MGPKPNDWHPCKKRKRHRVTETGEKATVTVKAEMAGIQLQVKQSQGLPEIIHGAGEDGHADTLILNF